MKTLFLDTEFTELSQAAELLSIALVDENNRWFYAVFSDTKSENLSSWHQENIVPFISLTDVQLQRLPSTGTYLQANKQQIISSLLDWLSAYRELEVWADVPAYDWVLFSELFGGARQLPKQIHYIVRDLATYFTIFDIDPDTDRFEIAYQGNPPPEIIRHNALGDAMTTKAIYEKLIIRNKQ